jgi:hypothetical protein
VTELVPAEPPLSGRVWMRHKQTSDRGYLVEREGRKAIRYDRGPAIDQHVFNVGDWEPLSEALPALSVAHVAQVCFEADKKLCWALGHHDLARREWIDLNEKTRVKWIKDGPSLTSPAYDERKKLYDAVKGALT